MKLWRATSDRKWRDRKEDCPGGGVEYVARKAAEDAAREAAIAAAEGVLQKIADWNCCYRSILKTDAGKKGFIKEFGEDIRAAKEALAQLRAAKGAE